MDIVGWWLRKPPKALLARLAHARPTPFPADPKRILVVREGGFGDLILTVPIIRTLRRHFGPNVIIDALVREPVVDTYKDLDQINCLFAKTSKLAQALPVIRQMRKRKYDVVIDLVSSPSLSFALWILRAAPGAHRVGGDKAELKGMYHQHIELPPRPSIHFMERLRRIAAQAVGDVPLADDVPWFNWPEEVKQQADSVWASIVDLESNGHPPGPVVLINMSAGIPRRTWSDAKYRELLPRLLAKYGDMVHRWILTAAPHEFHRATELMEYTKHPNVVTLPTQPDFRIVAALTAKISLVITPDTSIVHACSAHGTPVVVFTVNENIKSWSPWNCPHEIVLADVAADVESIEVDAVETAIVQLAEKALRTSA